MDSPASAVVWIKLPSAYCNLLWPYKVLERDAVRRKQLVESFQDHDVQTVSMQEAIPFITRSETICSLVENNVKKIHKKPKLRERYLEAIREVVDFVKEMDSEFTLDLDFLDTIDANTSVVVAGTSGGGVLTQGEEFLIEEGLLSSTPVRATPSSHRQLRSRLGSTGSRKRRADDEDGGGGGDDDCLRREKLAKKRKRTTPSRKKTSRGQNCNWDGDHSMENGGNKDSRELAMESGGALSCSATCTADGASNSNGKSRLLLSPIPNHSTRRDSLSGSNSDASSTDSDLPPITLSFVKENVKVYELKIGEIVWAKLPWYPYWPAIVVGVTKQKSRAKSYVKVRFFGSPEEEPLFRFKRKVHQYGTAERKKLLQDGESSSESAQFNLAVKEADNLLNMRREDQEISKLPPMEQITKLIKQRSYVDRNLLLHLNRKSCLSESRNKKLRKTLSDAAATDEQPGSVHGGGEDFSSGSEESLLPSSEDEEDPEYPFATVLEQLYQLKPTLERIVKGQEDSRFHRMFTSGGIQERDQLKKCEKLGPLGKMKHDKIKQVSDYLQKVAREASIDRSTNCFTYSFEVLLPEAMARIISTVEDIKLTDAYKKL